MKLSSVTSADTELVRTITWNSQTHQPILLATKIQYIPPDTLKERSDSERAQILSARKLSPIENVREVNDAWQRIVCAIFASAIKSITLHDGSPVTLKQMRVLMALSPDQVAKFGGIDTPVAMNSEDRTPVTDEDRTKFGYEKEIQTYGDVARQNIQYLLRVCTQFRTFVEQIIQDISYFQDGDWEKTLKNS